MGSVIVKNGSILPMNENNDSIENMLIENGKIKKLNLTESEMKEYGNSEIIDLEGQTCVPGFHDSHMHMILYGYNCKYCADLSIAKSVEEVQDILRGFIEKNNVPTGQWITGIGWNQENFGGQMQLLKKEDLDAVSTEHYILAKRVCIHTATANSRLLELCNITKDTYLSNTNIGRDANGEPNGLIYENAISEIVLVTKPSIGLSEIEEIILDTTYELKSLGLTSIQTDDMKAFSDFESKKNIIRAYDKLRKENKLPIRIFEQIQVSSLAELIELRRFLEEFEEDDVFSFSTVKLILDGSLGACTAAIDRPYKSSPKSKGILNFRDQEIYEITKYCYEHDLQIMFHVIGNRAIDQATRILENVKTTDHKERRPRFVHVQIATLDVLDRMSKLNAIADIQPTFVASDFRLINQKLTQLNRYALYSWNTMRKKGIKISGSSDCPVEPPTPLMGIACAVTRTNLHREPEGGWIPFEKLSIKEALKLFTTAPAYAVYMEEKLGRFEKGYYGDLAVLGSNPLETNCYQIHSIEVKQAICFME